jgi:sec-independent protein translocase protein TatB
MFDVGFSELILIALVALIVIGPERLPKVARTVGHLLGRLQRYVNDVKSDINREMQLDELKKLQEQVASQARDMERQVNDQMHSVETSLNASIAQGIEEKAELAATAPVATVPPAPTPAPAVTDKPAA